MPAEEAGRVVHVIGGGITGLTAALRLAQSGSRVVVHERSPYLGGLAGESRLDGVAVESFYHCVLPTDFRLLALLDEIGLEDAVGWSRTRTGFFDGTTFHELTTTADFLRFPPIGLVDRLRLAWTIAYCGAFRDGRRFGREPVGTFLRRHGGNRLFRRVWEPLLVSKLGPRYDRFAASFIWATIRRMLSARKARARAEKLGFVRRRYGRVFAALRRSIERAGGSVLSGQTLQGLTRGDDSSRWRLHFGDRTLDASAVLLCTPAPTIAELLAQAGLDRPARSYASIDHLGVVCEVLLLRRPLTPFYVLNLIGGDLPFTGVIETTNLTGTAEYGGRTLVYLPRYRSQDDSDWQVDDETVHEENVRGLRRVVPGLEVDDVVAWRIHRARWVQPVHAVDHGERIPPVELAPGLAALCSAHIYPWPVFNDEAVGNVQRHLPDVLRTLHASPLSEVTR